MSKKNEDYIYARNLEAKNESLYKEIDGLKEKIAALNYIIEIFAFHAGIKTKIPKELTVNDDFPF